MSEIGKKIRIERLMNRESRNMVIIPMDHGISDGPIEGLINITDTVNKVAEGGANAVLMQKGMVKYSFLHKYSFCSSFGNLVYCIGDIDQPFNRPVGDT